MNRQEQLDKLLAEGDGILQTTAVNMLKILKKYSSSITGGS